MLISGFDIKKPNTQVVTLVRGEDRVPLIVSALPNNFLNKYRKHGLCEWPEAPLKVKMSGKKIVMDKTTGQPVTEVDDKDPEFLQKNTRVSRHFGALTLRGSLRLETKIIWPVEEPSESAGDDEWLVYADALADAVEQSGLTFEEITEISKTSRKIAKPLDITEGAEDFLQTA